VIAGRSASRDCASAARLGSIEIRPHQGKRERTAAATEAIFLRGPKAFVRPRLRRSNGRAMRGKRDKKKRKRKRRKKGETSPRTWYSIIDGGALDPSCFLDLAEEEEGKGKEKGRRAQPRPLTFH